MMGRVWLFLLLDLSLTVLVLLWFNPETVPLSLYQSWLLGSVKGIALLIWELVSEVVEHNSVYWASTALFLFSNVCLSYFSVV